MGKTVSPEQEAARMELYNQGLDDRQIAERVGTKYGAIRSWRYVRKLPANASRGGQGGGIRGKKVVFTEEQQRQLRKLHSDGLNDAEIAQALGISRTTALRWRVERGLPTNHNPGGRFEQRENIPKLVYAAELAEGEYRCGGCQRVRCKGTTRYCAVLKEMIGQVRECSFWTADADWEERAEEAISKYARYSNPE